jgi:hypothetical protein
VSSTKEKGGRFTALGTNFFQWKPLASCSVQARFLWLALYSSNEAKRFPPGLWHGGLPVMAEAANLDVNVVWDALDELMTTKYDGAPIVEWDRDHRVARLVVLPDAHERAASWTHLKSWWSKFHLIPQCATRDAHVTTLRWLLDQGKAIDSTERVWDETFGTIRSSSRRDQRRLADSDTSTSVQPSLFGCPEPLPNPPPPPILPDVKKSPSEGVSDTPYEGVSEGVREGDRDRDRVFSSSPESDPERGDGEISNARPRLALVPPEALVPFTVSALLMATTGRPEYGIPAELASALQHAVEALGRRGVTASDLEYVSLARAAGELCHERPVRWASDPDNVQAAIAIGMRIKQEQRERSEAFAELRGKLGV